MSKEIIFPEVEPQYVFDRACLSFRAKVDGKPVDCLVSAELLFDKFGAEGFSEPELKFAFQNHREEIQAIARFHIEMGWIDSDNRVLLTRFSTTLRVKYQDALQNWEEGYNLATRAFSILENIIGPNVGEVSVEWDRGEDARGRSALILRLSDKTSSVSAIIDPSELQSPHMRTRLLRIWSDLLSIRSKKQLQLLG